jgi:hypothetical protein
MLGIIGSRAMNHWVSKEHQREPNDFDIIGTYDEIEAFINHIKRFEKVKAQYPTDAGKKIFIKTDKRIIEAEVAWDKSNGAWLHELINRDGVAVNIDGFDMMVCPFLLLYTLKMSHRYLKDSPHFLKTMRDIQMARTYGATIPECYEEFYKERQRIQYAYKLPKLNQKKDTFFSGDGIDYEYDHDSLHEALKFMDNPAYTYYADGEVWSSKEKFHACSEDVKLFGVLEESLVLACERSQLAFNPAPDARWSFEYALFKVCTSITSGFFREYAWENYDAVVALYEKIGTNYAERAKAGIESGIVKRLKKDKSTTMAMAA